eukprot:3631943-Alexandrium_andersonii.AAC.1
MAHWWRATWTIRLDGGVMSRDTLGSHIHATGTEPRKLPPLWERRLSVLGDFGRGLRESGRLWETVHM